MPNYNIDVPTFEPFSNPMKTGADMGATFGKIASGVASIKNIDNASANKAKVDQFIQEYNSGTGAFAGIEGSLKTRKLARLLLPLDSALSQKYLSQADIEANKEEKIKQNQEVVNARKGVVDTEEDVQGMSDAQEEIKLIEQEIANRASQAKINWKQEQSDLARPDYSSMPPIGTGAKYGVQ